MATPSKILQPKKPNIITPFIHQRQMISAPWACPEVSYFELCGGYGPLDCDTEFLTQTGWKRIADYAPGDKVLQYNMEDNTAEFVNPEAYYKLPAKELYSVKTKMALDWTMAEEHRQPIWRKRKGKWTFDRVYTAGELLTEHSSSTKVATSWKGLKSAGEWKYTEWETRLLIAASADGRYDTKYTTHCRMKLKKERKIKRLKMLLDKCGIEYKTGTDTDGCALFFFYTPVRVKEYSPEWYNCPSDIFCDEVLRWDGTAKEQEYYTNSKNNADMVQFHFSNAGYRATISQNKSKLPLILYTVHYSTATFIGFIQDGQKPEKIKAPDGYKYCFTVPSSFIVVRKNNKIFITGNCGKSNTIVFLIITLSKRYQGQDVTIALCSTTITLLNKTVILELAKLLKKTGSLFDYNQKDNIITIGTVRFLLIATGQPTDIYGPNVNITLCDEVDELPEQKAIEAHKALSERTRITLPDGRKPFIMYFSTVHGYRGLYKVVQELKESRLPNVLVRGLTKNNTSLDPDYVKRLYAIYDEQERLAYLEGRFVNLQSGRVFGNYDEATCKCEPFEITPKDTIYVGQDLNSGFSKATAIVKRNKCLYIIRGWSFKEIGGAPAIMRNTYKQNEILWFPDCSGKEILKGYREEIIEHEIECRIGSSNPRILDTVFYVNKLFKMGKLKVFDCRETDEVSEALKVQAYNDMGMPEKGKGEKDPDHFTDSVRYVIYRIVRSDEDFMDLKELSREEVQEHGYLQIAGQTA